MDEEEYKKFEDDLEIHNLCHYYEVIKEFLNNTDSDARIKTYLYHPSFSNKVARNRHECEVYDPEMIFEIPCYMYEPETPQVIFDIASNNLDIHGHNVADSVDNYLVVFQVTKYKNIPDEPPALSVWVFSYSPKSGTDYDKCRGLEEKLRGSMFITKVCCSGISDSKFIKLIEMFDRLDPLSDPIHNVRTYIYRICDSRVRKEFYNFIYTNDEIKKLSSKSSMKVAGHQKPLSLAGLLEKLWVSYVDPGKRRYVYSIEAEDVINRNNDDRTAMSTYKTKVSKNGVLSRVFEDWLFFRRESYNLGNVMGRVIYTIDSMSRTQAKKYPYSIEVIKKDFYYWLGFAVELVRSNNLDDIFCDEDAKKELKIDKGMFESARDQNIVIELMEYLKTFECYKNLFSEKAG